MDTEMLHVDLHSTFNELLMLSDTQFIENVPETAQHWLTRCGGSGSGPMTKRRRLWKSPRKLRVHRLADWWLLKPPSLLLLQDVQTGLNKLNIAFRCALPPPVTSDERC